ncbi:MAG: signal peptidase I [Prevotella sp.]|nr:signal peptidase I [Prevotella sp.]
MRGTLRFILALTVALAVMLLVRALALQLCSIDGDALQPYLLSGDRVVVNRWSYGLRTGDGRLFPYGRLARQPVRRGDMVAFETEQGDGKLLLGRCTALPGDTVVVEASLLGDSTDLTLTVPAVSNCDREDCYYIDGIGIVPEHLIIGRATMILYNRRPGAAPLRGYRRDRLLLGI